MFCRICFWFLLVELQIGDLERIRLDRLWVLLRLGKTFLRVGLGLGRPISGSSHKLWPGRKPVAFLFQFGWVSVKPCQKSEFACYLSSVDTLCPSVECFNDGQCFNIDGKDMCLCPMNYSGQDCGNGEYSSVNNRPTQPPPPSPTQRTRTAAFKMGAKLLGEHLWCRAAPAIKETVFSNFFSTAPRGTHQWKAVAGGGCLPKKPGPCS